MYTLSPSFMDENGVILLENVANFTDGSFWPGFSFERVAIKGNVTDLRMDFLGVIYNATESE